MFKFKLQTILDVRKTMEEKVLYEFSEQQRDLEKEKEHLHSIQKQIAAIIDVLRNIQGKTVNIYEISMNTTGIKNYRVSEDIQKQRVQEATILLETKREALQEAMKKRKAMEIIKTKYYEKYLFDANLLERTANDEMTIVRHRRREEE